MDQDDTTPQTVTVTITVSGTDTDGETVIAEALDYWNWKMGADSGRLEMTPGVHWS